MTAQTVYQKVVRLSLRSAVNLSKRRLDELSAGIGELRQLLSCVVCCQLLVDPYVPKGKHCHHYVCRLCIRGRKRLMSRCRQCEDCSDFKTYEENRLMAVQLLCYKTLCVHLLQSSMFTQLAGQFPDLSHVAQFPRIRLPPMTTQEFIREGTNYDDIRETFLPQPDLPFLKNLPLSLPAETPPTTAATTPELPYEQNLPEQLSITDIEMEAAATAEQSQFSHPLPLMPTGSRMGLMAVQPPFILNEGSLSTEAGYTENSWNELEQVDLSDAVSMSSFPNNTTGYAMTYVMPTAASTPFESHPPQALQIGQVVRIEASPQPALLAITTAEVELFPSQKRKIAQLDMDQEQELQNQAVAPASVSQLVLQQEQELQNQAVAPASVSQLVLQQEACLENVSHDAAYLQNIIQDEAYLENVSQEEGYLETVSQESFLESVSQLVIPEIVSQEKSQEMVHQDTIQESVYQEKSQEISSQDVVQESASQDTCAESVTEEIYKEIVIEEVYQESASQEAGTQEQSVIKGIYQEIVRPSASQETASKKTSKEESVAEEIYQEIVRPSASEESERKKTSKEESVAEEIYQEIVRPSASQESASKKTSKEESVTEEIYQEVATPSASQESASKKTSKEESVAEKRYQDVATTNKKASQEKDVVEEIIEEVARTSEEFSEEERLTEELYQAIARTSAPQETSSQATSQGNASSNESYEEVTSSEEELSSSQEYTPTTTTRDKKKDTEINPASSKRSCAITENPFKLKANKAPSPTRIQGPVSNPVPVPVPVPVPAKLSSTKTSVKSSAKTTTKITTTGSSRRSAGKTKEKPPKPICRCGTSGVAVNPKTTCRNTRCPCYKSGNTCTNCHCVGCHNPHKTDFLDSDDEDEEFELENLEPTSLPNPQNEKKSTTTATPTATTTAKATPAPTAKTTATPTATKEVNAEKAASSQGGISLVPLSNLQQSQHPLVLVQNENGEYQGFNIFQGTVPIDPATVGFLRVQLQNNDPKSKVPQYAYVMPHPTLMAADVAPPPAPAPAPEPKPKPKPVSVEQPPAKKFKPAIKRSARLRGFAPRNTIDELVSGGSSAISNSAAGDRLSATDNAHSLFEEIMSGSDGL
ncbi:E3 ubiquitin-protein ligase msl-2 [Drosophila pseudoobscura]|uniref:E3 ubiquitin-protein ligase msl-2 n=1 Tax=Drosophila pseudoobscura pseudoobscura TaxID=46245 RepID=A0A6I8UJL4_DROPS|nr:E3 ubiquitin-protein ligase msl-2 [Drosophila pseudoobscura]